MQIYLGKEPYMEDKWQEIKEIEAQRSAIITKLEKIEEKKSHVSNEVYEKVKEEYEAKLAKIEEGMTQHVDLIKGELQNLKQEEKSIAEEERDINLELEEIELRYSIGEYDEESYNRLSQETRVKLNNVKTKFQKAKDRKEWLTNFVEGKGTEQIPEAAKPAAESKEPEKPVEEPPKPAEEPPKPAQEPPKPAQEPPKPAEEPAKPVEELPKLVEEPEEPPKEPEKAVEEPKAPEEKIEIEEHILEEKLPEEATKLDELLVEEEAVKPEMPEEEAAPKKPEEPPKEQNVACPKCGYLNSPDSWYCEKCGAEILDTPTQ